MLAVKRGGRVGGWLRGAAGNVLLDRLQENLFGVTPRRVNCALANLYGKLMKSFLFSFWVFVFRFSHFSYILRASKAAIRRQLLSIYSNK